MALISIVEVSKSVSSFECIDISQSLPATRRCVMAFDTEPRLIVLFCSDGGTYCKYYIIRPINNNTLF